MKKYTVFGTAYYCYPCTAICEADNNDETMRQEAILVISTNGTETSEEVVFGYELPKEMDDFLEICGDGNAWESDPETLYSVLCPALGEGHEPWKSYVWD